LSEALREARFFTRRATEPAPSVSGLAQVRLSINIGMRGKKITTMPKCSHSASSRQKFREERPMRALNGFVIIATGSLCGTALAGDLSGAEIKELLAGNTVYVQTTAASAGGQAGQTVIYWDKDGTALYRSPSGTIMHGTWAIKANTNCAIWKERSGMGCVRYDQTGDGVTIIDVASGQVLAKILKTAPGNAEKLTP
jgi:hypothetical protein